MVKGYPDTLDEGQRAEWPKHCDKKNKDEDNSPNTNIVYEKSKNSLSNLNEGWLYRKTLTPVLHHIAISWCTK